MISLSSTPSDFFQILPFHPLRHTPDEYDNCLTTHISSPVESTSGRGYRDQTYNQRVAPQKLHSQPQDEHQRPCMTDPPTTQQPQFTVEAYDPALLPLAFDSSQYDTRHDSASVAADLWSMYQPSMSLAAPPTYRPLKRARTHQRTPSASTIASTGPESPYPTNTLYPQVANTEFSPSSPAQAGQTSRAPYADQAFSFSKPLPTPSQTPTDSAFYYPYIQSQFSQTPNAQWPVRFDYQPTAEDIAPDFYQSSRPSMSSHGNNSPATPRSGAGEDAKQQAPVNEYRPLNPNVQLFRTESQAYQDELYNPAANHATSTSSAPKRQPDMLTPHRNLINERLQTANLARTGSPTSAISRERSPFRDGSPLAPALDWHAAQAMGTAAGMRQQQKEEAAQAEFAQHLPQLQREPTKTISPKDAELVYTEAEQPSLFQETIPAGYRQHTGAADAWQNGYATQPGSSFGNLVANAANSHLQPFRQASADNEANYAFMQLPQGGHQDQTYQIPSLPYQGSSGGMSKINYNDANPEFPAHLTSMESSLSDNNPPASSQESFKPASVPQRPADTRANTGTYTCTYHGCTQRFESHASLQKHKKEIHRPVQREHVSDENANTGSGTTTSPRSTESPAPHGMTSAAIQARNSQAGPHKCTRINPSTGKPCNTIFSRPYDLTRHEETIHNNRKQKVRCPMCREEKTFSRNDALTRHMRVVHPEVEQFGKRGRRAD